jgi:hypothetical protein
VTVRRVSIVLAGLCVTANVPAQEPPPSKTRPPAPVPEPASQPHAASQPDDAVRAEADALLRRHAERHRKGKVLVADYVQRRTTSLAKEPLVSSGRLLFVRDPACVLFRGEKPRPSVVRLTATTYEVHRPHRQQLERFHLEGPDLSTGLFAAIGGDANRLAGDYELLGCAPPVPESPLRRIRLRPRDESMRQRLSELAITVAAKDGALTAIAYRDAAGDLVEIELRAVEWDPEPAPSAELDVPRGTKVIEHRAAKDAAGKDAAGKGASDAGDVGDAGHGKRR